MTNREGNMNTLSRRDVGKRAAAAALGKASPTLADSSGKSLSVVKQKLPAQGHTPQLT